MDYMILEDFVWVLAVFGVARALFAISLALMLVREGLVYVSGAIPKARSQTSQRA
jgi:hypothetical protein